MLPNCQYLTPVGGDSMTEKTLTSTPEGGPGFQPQLGSSPACALGQEATPSASLNSLLCQLGTITPP